MIRFAAIVAFSGECAPDVNAAEVALRNAGFEVVRMPDEYRSRLAHPRDDFFAVSKRYALRGCDVNAASDAMVDSLNAIVDEHGGAADDVEPVADDHAPVWWPADEEP
jgi:hypothetical protein